MEETATVTLTEFLNARLDEDEHIAKMAAEDASASANWHVDARYQHSGHAGVSGENGEVVVYDEGSPAQMEAEHIARHDPARVLRDVKAGRQILSDYEEAAGHRGASRVAAVVAQVLYAQVANRARVYIDHPEFRYEWGIR